MLHSRSGIAGLGSRARPGYLDQLPVLDNVLSYLFGGGGVPMPGVNVFLDVLETMHCTYDAPVFRKKSLSQLLDNKIDNERTSYLGTSHLHLWTSLGKTLFGTSPEHMPPHSSERTLPYYTLPFPYAFSPYSGFLFAKFSSLYLNSHSTMTNSARFRFAAIRHRTTQIHQSRDLTYILHTAQPLDTLKPQTPTSPWKLPWGLILSLLGTFPFFNSFGTSESDLLLGNILTLSRTGVNSPG